MSILVVDDGAALDGLEAVPKLPIDDDCRLPDADGEGAESQVVDEPQLNAVQCFAWTSSQALGPALSANDVTNDLCRGS